MFFFRFSLSFVFFSLCSKNFFSFHYHIHNAETKQVTIVMKFKQITDAYCFLVIIKNLALVTVLFFIY